MFDFFKKRLARKTGDATHPTVVDASENSVNVSLPAKQIALIQADELAGDESAAVEFILHCQFSDARLAAAAHVHSRPMVERVLNAMRNTDRRVVKLMQKRLDICSQWEAAEQQANRCIAQAAQLVQARNLAPNQVADLDKQWQAIAQVTPPLQHAFDAARFQLQQRLGEQVRLQRAVHDALIQVRAWCASEGFQADASAPQQLAAIERYVAEQNALPEAASLPRNLLADVERELTACRTLVAEAQRNRAALDARSALLAQWETAEADCLDHDGFVRSWNSLPALPPALLSPLQARFEALCARGRKKPQTQEAPQENAAPVNRDAQQLYDAALDGLEHALQDGALQAAAAHNKTLQALNAQQVRPHPRQLARFSRLRAELTRLQGWARWGGNVSREELLHAAQSLIAQPLPATELASKVGSLRERWKSLDASAGPAPRELWLRFDEACSHAYAPAAAYFRKLAEEREQHAVQAQAWIDECKAYADKIVTADAAGQMDWKSVAAFLDRLRQAWRRIGPIDRKEKKRLDTAFREALDRLAMPLELARGEEIKLRQQLIEQAAGLDPYVRSAVDELRDLQAQWQHRAKTLPLERGQEQELWQQFRAQCDRVFAARKETSQAADAERRAHLQEKEALCARMEAARDGPVGAIRALLRQSERDWEQIGPVPRANEQQVSQRYLQASEALRQRLLQANREQQAAVLGRVQAKLRLCVDAEQRFGLAQADLVESLPALQAQWEALEAGDTQYDQALQGRFNKLMHAAQSRDQAYAASLADNRPAALRQLLRLEMALGLESPPAQARERLQVQVSELQNALKSRQQALQSGHERALLEVCRLPALLDEEASRRLDRIMASNW